MHIVPLLETAVRHHGVGVECVSLGVDARVLCDVLALVIRDIAGLKEGFLGGFLFLADRPDLCDEVSIFFAEG